jgi:antitoxin component YwqK of YwqJK toxin-antitoxin module
MNNNIIINRIIEINSNIIKFVGSFDENNKKTGYWKCYYKNGTLQSNEYFLDGKRNGESIYYWRGSGNISAIGNYVDNREEDKWVYYHNNGFIESEGEYLCGKREGLWSYYWSDGTIRNKVNYKNGLYNELK